MARHSRCSPARHIYPGRELACEGQPVIHGEGRAGTQTGYRKDRCRCCDCREWKRRDQAATRHGGAPVPPLAAPDLAPVQTATPRRPAQEHTQPRAERTVLPAASRFTKQETSADEAPALTGPVLTDMPEVPIYDAMDWLTSRRIMGKKPDDVTAFNSAQDSLCEVVSILCRTPELQPVTWTTEAHTTYFMLCHLLDEYLEIFPALLYESTLPRFFGKPKTWTIEIWVDSSDEVEPEEDTDESAPLEDIESPEPALAPVRTTRAKAIAATISPDEQKLKGEQEQARHQRDCANGVHTQEITDQVTGRVFCRWCSVTLRPARHQRDCENNVHTKQITDPVTGRIYCNWCQVTLRHGYPPDRPITWASYDPGSY